MPRNRGLAGLLFVCLALLATACGLDENTTFRTYRVVTPSQKATIETSTDEGIRALLDQGYSPVAFRYYAKRSGERVGVTRLVFAVCKEKTLEECYLEVDPSTSRPLVTTVVTSKPTSNTVESTGTFYLSYPYTDFDHRVCVDVEASTATPSASPGTKRVFSIGITPNVVNNLEKIGEYFKSKRYSYGNPKQYTKQIGSTTWRCVPSAA